MGKSPQELYKEREKRFHDAVALRKPDRVPIAWFSDYFVTRHHGLTNKEAMNDYDRMAKAFKATVAEFNWDMAPLCTIRSAPLMEAFGLKQFIWPGHGLSDDLPFQFVEDEYMTADEYDQFLADPGDFTVRTLMPRNAKILEPLAQLPPLHWFSGGYTLEPLGGMIAGLPPFVHMLDAISKVGAEAAKWNAVQAKLTKDLAEMGFPMITLGACIAPYDWITDMLRGMRGIMLDMYRNPDKLLATIDMLLPMAIHSAIGLAHQTGNPRIFIPLHRGAGGFMSNEQFAKFYWPSLKKVMLALIDAGLTPMPFFEGDYTPRLEFLAEMPKGKVCGWFDIIDLKKAKQIIGDNMCFMGNVPAQLLCVGTPQENKDYVKKLIDTFGDNGGLIINGAVSGIPAESRPENVHAVTEAVYEFGVYK